MSSGVQRYIFYVPSSSAAIRHSLRRTLHWLVILFSRIELQKHKLTKEWKAFLLFYVFVSLCLQSLSQTTRTDISLDDDWHTIANDSNQKAFDGFEQTSFNTSSWEKVQVPHNWDAYEGYRRLRHGNRHGYAWYRKTFSVAQQPASKRIFLFFEGVGSYATVWLNGKQVGYHAGGRTTFTIDITNTVKYKGQNVLAVRADHPAYITDLPWVCGGCSDDRGFSEGSQPMGIFRPVHLIITNDARIEPFGVHVWNDAFVSQQSAQLFYETEVKNYSASSRNITIANRLVDRNNKLVNEIQTTQKFLPNAVAVIRQQPAVLKNVKLWSLDEPYLYTLLTEIKEGGKVIDRIATPYGIRSISWPIGKKSSGQFLLNGKPVFINGIAEYEHLLGSSHAFTAEQIKARIKQIKAAGFNAFRDAHQPHNLRYQPYWDSLGILWWTQMSAHNWNDNEAFRSNFKTLLKEWVKERRNQPSLVLWGLQNESKLPADFAQECTEIIRQMDPTTSSQRLVTTCNGGEGTDWDVPQNWTGTYGGNPATYSEDVKRQVLIGEYGAWRTLGLHTEGSFVQNGTYSEDRMTQLMEMKVRLGEAAKDSTSGHFMWLLTSHDNPGRVQGGEGFRELDRIGPVNYKGLLTPWEEPTDAYFMYRSNYADKRKEPMVYIVSHTWPDRWTKPGKKDGIVVYSNCDSVELFNDVLQHSLGKRGRGGKGTHFQWDGVDVQYNVLYAVGYVAGKVVAKDYVVLHHLPQSPNFNTFYKEVKNITAPPQAGYNYLYRVNCGGASYTDVNGNTWQADRNKTSANTWGSSSWSSAFTGMLPFFASQRSISDPVKGTKDWTLFQNFRYGRDELTYEFPVQDGEYRVELYFTEPWWGRGDGMDAKGMRVFDVAVNDKAVIKNLDIWKESGYTGALKKVMQAKVIGGKLKISFPHVAVGQAVISAIAIATLNKAAKAAPSPEPIIKMEGSQTMDWLNTGDEILDDKKVQLSVLPSALYGAQWIKAYKAEGANKTKLVVTEEADVYVATLAINNAVMPEGFSDTKEAVQLNDGRSYNIYKKRTGKTELLLDTKNIELVMALPANKMEPAYDLKAVANYKAVAAKLIGTGVVKGKVDGKDRVIFEKASAGNGIEWNMSVGVADVYSLTISYNNPTQEILKGHLQLLAADGTVMKEEDVEFTPTRVGKSNYINTTTGSMINAGNYVVKLNTGEASNLSVNALDVQ